MLTDQENPVHEMAAPSRPADTPPHFQYGISTLFWIMTATAVLCALLFPMPAYVALPVMLFISVAVLPAVWTTVIVYGRGYQRTFAIGAMFPSTLLFFEGWLMFAFGSPSAMLDQPNDNGMIYRLIMLGFWVSSLLVGIICVGVRRFLEKRSPAPSLSGPSRESLERQNGE